MPRVAVLTTFVHRREAYSLCNVVEMHLRMLLANGYETTFVGCDGFAADGVYGDSRLHQARIPYYMLNSDEDSVKRSDDFNSAVDRIAAAIRPLMPQIDVVITHDIAYLQNFLAYNEACRRLAKEFPRVKWLHFLHSAPWPHQEFADSDPRSSRFKPFPNSFLLYPNFDAVPAVGAQYRMSRDLVKVVPHPFDWENAFDFHPLTRSLIHEYELYSPDVFAIYPIRMDRGKQPEKLVRLFSAIKSAGVSIQLLIINFHSIAPHQIEYRNSIIRECAELGLTQREIVFTNNIGSLPEVSPRVLDRYRFEVPHRVVLDLFRLTNIYVHPSKSEAYSLVCQEAAASGNAMFLNSDFPAMRGLYGDEAHYLSFSSPSSSTWSKTAEMAYYAEAASQIVMHLHTDTGTRSRTRLRQTRNPDIVFRNWLEPLLYSDASSMS